VEGLNGDTALLLWINAHHAAVLDALLVAVATLGEFGAVWWMLSLGLAVWGGPAGRRTALLCVIALLVTHVVLYAPLHLAWHRPRPYLDPTLTGVRQLGLCWGGSSFPSGHADVTLAATVVLGARQRRWRWPLIVFAALTCYSRPYAGMHYPSDVLTGAVVGLLGGLATLLGQRWLERRPGAKPDDLL
jgi:undecaprenyl-diphosphatase